MIRSSTSFVLVLLAAACSPRVQQGPQPQARDHALTVEVQNQNHTSATIYAFRSGFRDRLGAVEATNTKTFAFNWPTYDVRFLIDFLGKGCVITERLSVDPGDDLLLVIRVIDDDGASQSRCRTPALGGGMEPGWPDGYHRHRSPSVG